MAIKWIWAGGIPVIRKRQREMKESKTTPKVLTIMQQMASMHQRKRINEVETGPYGPEEEQGCEESGYKLVRTSHLPQGRNQQTARTQLARGPNYLGWKTRNHGLM